MFREYVRYQLGIDHLPVQPDIELTVTGRDQNHRLETPLVFIDQMFRQTDGLGLKVSYCAICNRYFHLSFSIIALELFSTVLNDPIQGMPITEQYQPQTELFYNPVLFLVVGSGDAGDKSRSRLC